MEPVIPLDQFQVLIQIFLTSPSEQERHEAEKIITLWQQSPASIQSSLQIISSLTDSNICFIAGGCIRYSIRYNFRIFSFENLSQIVLLLLEKIRQSPDRINSPENKLYLIIICDICLLCNQLIQSTLESLPPNLIILFFKILLEEANLPFVQKYDTNRVFKNTLNQLCPFIISTLNGNEVSKDWLDLYYLVFQRYENTDILYPLLPKISNVINNPDFSAELFTLFFDTFSSLVSDSPSFPTFLEAIIMMSLQLCSAHMEYSVPLFGAFFNYDTDFFYDDTRVKTTFQLIEIFLRILPTLLNEENIFDTCENFSKFIIEYPNLEITLPYIFQFLNILIQSVHQNQSYYIYSNLKNIFYSITNTIDFNQPPQSQMMNQFIFNQEPSEGFYLFLQSFAKLQSSPYLAIQMLNKLFEMQNLPKNSLGFIQKIANQEYIIPYLHQIIQTLLYLFPQMQYEVSSTLKTITLFCTKEMIPFFESLFNVFSSNILKFELNTQAMIILMFLKLSEESNNVSILPFIQEVMLQNTQNAVNSMDEIIIERLCLFLIKIAENSIAQYSKEFKGLFFTPAFVKIFEILTPIMIVNNENMLNSYCDLFNCLIKCDLIDYSLPFNWINVILPHHPLPKHFEILRMMKAMPTETILQFILSQTSEQNSDLLICMIQYLTEIFPKIESFWTIIPFPFMLNFFNSSWDVRNALIKFFATSFFSPESKEIIPIVVQAILTNFMNNDLFNVSNQQTAIELFIQMKENNQNPNCIFEIFTKMYPRPTPAGQSFIEELAKAKKLTAKLCESIRTHIQFNLSS